ncbi:lipase [Mycolicibacterium mageritense DSM 44476 = CIP 104973]|uniref:Lipase n=1 Tax=Mycolicibacterium mageritense TaxID=53462 RepID=A0ABM7I231_MYCME|nr:lipase family protein [Mycolicibacterium mageritense]MCC9183995.1 lipase family protein [Mycolicibacterium mageritense]TXI65564.1 MAG: lipase [Mycolicibacterium mageritense]BBX36945.1 lipase [Mycolicibacterium mageritense]CDO26575.1 lipase [Mycolicibacterium mageritense DSM 44476 = CIP 104973]
MDLGSVANAVANTPEPEWIGRAPHEELNRGDRPRLPSEDPFYLPPAGFQHASPGTVLRSRDVELAFVGLIPQRLHATQLLYRSTDRNGAPEAAATTVIMPPDPKPNCPIVSYQCAIDAISSRCFPSYALRRHAKATGSLAQLELLLVSAALAKGWAVSVPDHEGVNGMWGAPYEPGYHVLDGLRAALNSEHLALSPTAPIGLWGYSGGGLASAWAAEMSGSYAPELNIVGAVLGSPVGDLGHTFRRLNGTMFSGLPALVVAALADIYPGLNRIVEEHATAKGRKLLDRLHRMSTVEAVLRLVGTDMADLIDMPLEQILETPEVTHVFDDIKLGVAIPAPPVLIVQAVYDEIISVDDIDALVDTYAAGGADVTYHRDLFTEHLLLHPLSAPMTLRWLEDRFTERPLTEHLVRTKWPTMLNPMTYVGMARLAGIGIKMVTGRTIGRMPL